MSLKMMDFCWMRSIPFMLLIVNLTIRCCTHDCDTTNTYRVVDGPANVEEPVGVEHGREGKVKESLRGLI